MWGKKRLSVTYTPRSLKRPATLLKRRISTVDKSSNIKVVVRVRPPSMKDSANRQVIQVVDENCLVFDPKEYEENFYVGGHKQLNRDMLKKRNKNIEFNFDRIFDQDANNQEVFEGTTQNLIASLLDGFNSSVFVYGATGAGKTYTMLGSKETPGIAYLTMVELYKSMEAKSDHKFDLKISYLEVYNEMVKDLICPSGPLPLRDDGKDGIIISGIKTHHINSADELFQMLECGNRNRTQHPTDANAESSRSHAVFQVHLCITHKLTLETKISKLTMIDLAGSERGVATGGKGVRFSEGSNINKSLLALGNCVDALAEGHKHIPYRNSKLTRILKDSLGGNCKTVMIVNVAPTSLAYEETFNTLNYANRAKKISNRIRRNLLNVDMSANQYKKIIEELKQKNLDLENEIQSLKEGKITSNEGKDTCSSEVCPDIVKGRQVLRCLYELEGKYRKELLMYQIKKKTLDWRINQKQVISERFQLFEYMLADTKSKSRMDDSVSNLKMQRKVYQEKVKSIQKLLKEKQTLREVALKDIKAKGLMGELQKDVEHYAGKMKEEDLQVQVKYFKDLLLKQQHEMASSDKIVTCLCRNMDYYYSVLNGSGKVTEQMKEEYFNLVQQLSGMKAVSWEDEPCEYTMLRRVMDLSFVSEDSRESPASFSPREYENLETSAKDSPMKKETIFCPALQNLTPVVSNYRVPSTPSIGLQNIAQYLSPEGEDMEMELPNKKEPPVEMSFPILKLPAEPDFNKTFCVVASLDGCVDVPNNVSTKPVFEKTSVSHGCKEIPVVLNTTFDSPHFNDEEKTSEKYTPEQTSSCSSLNVTFTMDTPPQGTDKVTNNDEPVMEQVNKSWTPRNKLFSQSVLKSKVQVVKSNLPVVRNVSSSAPSSSGSGQKTGSGSRSQLTINPVKERIPLQPNERFKVRPGATVKIQYSALADKNKLPANVGVGKNNLIQNGKKPISDDKISSRIHQKENQATLPLKRYSPLISPSRIGNVKFLKLKGAPQDKKMRV